MNIQTIKLTKKYGQLIAVDQIDLTVQKGQIFGLLGPNGAGKSTTISMLSTLIKPTTGQITIDGIDIVKTPQAIRPRLGVVPQEIALYTNLSGAENLKFWGKAYGLKGDVLTTRIAEVADFIGIAERLIDRVDNYSGGMKRRLNIGVALLHRPELLILDEPTVGIDPQSRNHILERIKALNESGTTIIYTSHYMEEVEAICDDIAIIDHGKIIARGTKAALLKNSQAMTKINVQFDSVDHDMIDQLQKLNGVQQLIISQDKISFLVPSSQMVEAVFNTAKQHGKTVLSVSVTEPNLETVFLELTGKALRD